MVRRGLTPRSKPTGEISIHKTGFPSEPVSKRPWVDLYLNVIFMHIFENHGRHLKGESRRQEATPLSFLHFFYS